MAKATVAVSLLFAITLMFAGCGSGGGSGAQGKPIDPSGNWAMTFTDANNNHIILSALFDQVGSTVTAFNVLAAGNPSPFSCTPFSATFANGTVQNTDQFSGDIQTQSFGNVHFSSNLNPVGTHAQGTYSLTGSCWGVASTGTFSADEIPSVSGSWSGTLTCQSNCPTGSTSGTIMATLTQNDSTGAVSGTYTVSGLPDFGSGNVSTGQFDVLSGQNLQETMTDGNGNVYVLAGGPFQGSPFNTAGLGLDRTFHGVIIERSNHDPNLLNLPTYSVTMSH